MLGELLALVFIDAIDQLLAGLHAIFLLIDHGDGIHACAPLVEEGHFTRHGEVELRHGGYPRIGMIGHGVEEHSVHIEEHGLEMDKRMPAITKIAGYR